MSAPRHSAGNSYNRQKRVRDAYASDDNGYDSSTSVQSYRGSARNSQRGDSIMRLAAAQRNSGRIIGTPSVDYRGTARQVSFTDTPGATPAKPAAAASSSKDGAAPINVRNMEGYRGQLDDRIAARIRDISRRIDIPDLADYFPHLHNPGWRKRMPDANTNAAPYIDHTILKAEATKAEVTKLCDEAKKHNFYAVCVNGSRVSQCLEELRGSQVHVAAVIGFPLGAGTIRAHAVEARGLAREGVDEIDMVMNIGQFKDGNYRYVYEHIKAVVEASSPAIVKVIFESCLLTRDEVIDASIISVAAGAHFVKTSTGFNKGGATPEAIDAMLAVVGNEAEVKASGGVRDATAAGAYISAGVKRIGTSSGVAIVSGQKGSGY